MLLLFKNVFIIIKKKKGKSFFNELSLKTSVRS